MANKHHNTRMKRHRWKKIARLRIYEQQNRLCIYCKQPMQISDITLDHIIPTSRGGTDTEDNYAVCCVRCNMLKSDMFSIEYLRILRGKAVATNIHMIMARFDYVLWTATHKVCNNLTRIMS